MSQTQITEHAGKTEAIPYTELQKAYYFGEKMGLPDSLPGYYHEILLAPRVDFVRLDQALSVVASRHQALRCRPSEVGLLPLDAEVRSPGPVVIDRQGLLLDIKTEKARIVREILPHLDDYPPLICLLVRYADTDVIHFGGRLIIMDGFSWGRLVAEIVSLYREGSGAVLPPVSELRDVADFFAQRRDSAAYARDWAYWLDLIPHLAAGPSLPKPVDAAPNPRFTRLTAEIPPSATADLKAYCQKAGVSESAFLCAAYLAVLSLWAAKPAFSINVLFSERALKREFGNAVSNFSSTFILSVPDFRGTGFSEFAKRVGAGMLKAMMHSSCSGVEVVREMLRQRTHLEVSPHSFVFASMLGGKSGAGFRELGWRQAHSYVQTPNVWLDHQVFESGEGGIRLNWDFREDMLHAEAAGEMFSFYLEKIPELCAEGNPGTYPFPLPPSQFQGRPRPLGSSEGDGLSLAADIPAWAAAQGDKPALSHGERTLSYGEMLDGARKVAAALDAKGIRGRTVAIFGDRCLDYIVDMLGISLSGNAYLPLDPSSPPDRIQRMVDQGSPAAIVGAPEALRNLPEPIRALAMETRGIPPASAYSLPPGRAARGELAYTMFTSGSTGTPKGVMISHDAARNTLNDVVRRFGITERDKAFCVSPFHFDLSVFDIFALLGAGGEVVLAESDWYMNLPRTVEAIRRKEITVWNSVPALFQVFIEYCKARDLRLHYPRLVLLSGDWIPLQLVHDARCVLPGATLVSLGGATECSIWSNFHVIEKVAPHWKSIPYGRPLANQDLHVFSEEGRLVPHHVTGELWISGQGVALGYANDPERTAQAFVETEGIAGRCYRTGDLARMRPDGVVELLGRKDTQIKIRGYRVELGEIEKSAEAHAAVRQAIACVQDNAAGKSIILFVQRESALSQQELAEHLKSKLPPYMIPAQVRFVEDLPLTANGKVDRAALLRRPAKASGETPPPVSPSLPAGKVRGIWRGVLGIAECGEDQSFFELGGNSLSVLRLLDLLEKEAGLRVEAEEVFRGLTLGSLLGKLESSIPQPRRFLKLLRSGTDQGSVLVAIHPVGGNILCYMNLVNALRGGIGDIGVFGVQSQGLGKEAVQDLSMEQLAVLYAAEILSLPQREILLAGWSYGGVLANEMAGLLLSKDRRVKLFLIDPWISSGSGMRFEGAVAAYGFFNDLSRGALRRSGARPEEALAGPFEGAKAFLEAKGISLPIDAASFQALFGAYRRNMQALCDYRFRGLATEAVYFPSQVSSQADFFFLKPLKEVLAENAKDKPVLLEIPLAGNHYEVLEGDNLTLIAETLKAGARQPQAKGADLSGKPGPGLISNLVSLLDRRPSGSVPAVIHGSRSVGDEEFAGLMATASRAMRALGLRAGDRLVFLCEKSVESLACLYACVRDGIVFVPLDPAIPEERLASILEDCKPSGWYAPNLEGNSLEPAEKTLPGRFQSLPKLSDKDMGAAPAAVGPFPRQAGPSPAPDSLAYIIYTSGSTGKSKGVAVSHGALASFLASSIRRAGYGPGCRFLNFFPYHFDPMLMEIFMPWIVGGTVVLFDRMRFIRDLSDAIRLHAITDFSCTPNVVGMLNSRFSGFTPAQAAGLRSIWFGGEKPDVKEIAEFHQGYPSIRLFNGYGPTEAVVACSLHEVTESDLRDGGELPIGTPMDGVEFLIRNENGGDAGEGEWGILHVAGEQLMAGYWGQDPDRCFLLEGGKRFYDTKDVVRKRDGVYHYRGRVDTMVKVRGFRVYPEEAENLVLGDNRLASACFVYHPADKAFTAYLQVKNPATVQESEVWEGIRKRLPEYMWPEKIRLIANMPRLPSGKIHRKSLEGMAA